MAVVRESSKIVPIRHDGNLKVPTHTILISHVLEEEAPIDAMASMSRRDRASGEVMGYSRFDVAVLEDNSEGTEDLNEEILGIIGFFDWIGKVKGWMIIPKNGFISKELRS